MMAKKKRRRRNDRNDYDSAWKRALTRHLASCLLFFFPHVHAEIDWTRKVEFLDSALRAIMGGKKARNRQADQLVKVFLKNGESRWLLIHIEVQAQFDKDFLTRMWTYYYRAFDRYGVDVVSLAILADDNPNWRPDRYVREQLGCEASLKFPIVKLWDYRDRWDELEQSTNPFAFVVMAFLTTQATNNNAKRRFEVKVKLTKLLQNKGFSEELILAMYSIIDNMMSLPDNLERKFVRELNQIEEKKLMPFVSSLDKIVLKHAQKHFESVGVRKGRREGLHEGRVKSAREFLIELLEDRFGTVPVNVVEAISAIDDIDTLVQLRAHAKSIRSLDSLSIN